MKLSKAGKDKRFYISIFVTLTSSIAVTIFILSAILYINFEGILRKQIFSYTMENLSQTSLGTGLMSETANTIAKKIYTDIHISKVLNYTTEDVIEINTALLQLNYYRATSVLIDSIYIYNSESGKFYTSADVGENSVQSESNFYDQDIVKIVRNYKDYPVLGPIPRRIDVKYPANQQVDVYSFLLYDTLSSSEGRNIIVINISEAKLHRNIEGMISNTEQNYFMIDRSGVLISNGTRYPMLTDLSGESYIRKVLSTKFSGYFIADVKGVKSFIAYTNPDILEWRYMHVVPYSDITDRVARMKMMTAIIGVGILLCGLLISYILSRKLFKNVDTKLSQLKRLESEKRDSLHKLRQEYLRNIFQGEEKVELSNVRERFTTYDITMDVGGTIRVILFKIDHYRDFSDLYNNEDRNLFKYAIMNIVSEILSESFHTQAVDMYEDRIAVLLNVPSQDSEEVIALLESLIKKAQASVAEILKVSLSAVLSTTGDTIKSANLLYKQAVAASFHRLFYGHSCMIYTKDIMELKKKLYIYPDNKEKQMIEELMLGRIDEAKELMMEIIGDAAEYPYMSYNLAISHLSFTVNNVVYTIQNNSSSFPEFDINTLLMDLNNAETLEEVYKRFFEVFDSLASKVEERKNSKYDELVLRIVEMIHKEYMDQGLSIESIADSLGMSATYIGRLFKKYTMKTILDCIIETRMSKARELLLSTEYSVGEIAERTGFTNSPYFYKAFKKYNGVTPIEFRKNSRNRQLDEKLGLVKE